ncbi:hypothetical protein ACMYSQ_007486 [Aspergillus niger]
MPSSATATAVVAVAVMSCHHTILEVPPTATLQIPIRVGFHSTAIDCKRNPLLRKTTTFGQAKPTGYTRIADVILKSNLGLEEAHMISDRFGLAPSASQGGVYFQGTCRYEVSMDVDVGCTARCGCGWAEK